jgi:acetyl esterase/lipase
MLIKLQSQDPPTAKSVGKVSVERDQPGGVLTYWLAAEQRTHGTIVFLHGGAFIGGPEAGQWGWLSKICQRARIAAAAVIYRMPPRHPFPAALDDAIAAIEGLQVEGRLGEGNWLLAGDSAGGGLALAVAQALRDRGAPLPAGLLLTAPWADIEMANPELNASELTDPFLSRKLLSWCAGLYAGGAQLSDPRLSPLNGDMHGLPPVHLNVGTRDLLQPDVRRLQQALLKADVPVTYIEQEGGMHTYPQMAGAAGEWAVQEQVKWIATRFSHVTE